MSAFDKNSTLHEEVLVPYPLFSQGVLRLHMSYMDRFPSYPHKDHPHHSCNHPFPALVSFLYLAHPPRTLIPPLLRRRTLRQMEVFTDQMSLHRESDPLKACNIGHSFFGPFLPLFSFIMLSFFGLGYHHEDFIVKLFLCHSFSVCSFPFSFLLWIKLYRSIEYFVSRTLTDGLALTVSGPWYYVCIYRCCITFGLAMQWL